MGLLSRSLEQNKWELLGLGLILVIAAYLRLGWAGISSFGFDEARVSEMALQMLDGQFARLGMQSSTGIPNFPAAIWLYTIPLALSSNPQLAIWFTGLCNVTAVAGIWWLGRDAWGAAAGLCAALLFATAPYLVFYSRSVWSQNFLAPLAVLWAVTAVVGIQRDKPLALALHAFLAGFVAQVHLAGAALLFASLWLGLRYRLWRRWRPITLGAALALLSATPTIYTIWRYGDGAKAAIREMLAQESITDWRSFRQLGRLATGFQGESFWLGQEWIWSEPLRTTLIAASSLIALLIAGGIVAVVWQMLVKPESLALADGALSTGHILPGLLLVWGLVGPLTFLQSKSPAYPQYQLVSVPALFLAAAAFVGLSSRRRWQWTWTTVVLCIALAQSLIAPRALNRVADALYPGGMGTPLSYLQSAVGALQNNDQPIVVQTFGNNTAYDGDAAAFRVLLWDYPHQLVDARSTLLVPDEPAQLLFTYNYLPAWEVAQQVGLDGPVQEFPRRDGELSYWALSVDGKESGTGFNSLSGVKLANGAALTGWQLVELDDGQRIRLITLWEIYAEPEAGHFQQFNHLYVSGEDAPHAIKDVHTSSAAWQQGDRLITWADFDKPAAAIAFFHVGMYTWPDLVRSPQLEATDPAAPITLTVE